MIASKPNIYKCGFTLAEVLVVLFILGIASVIVIPMIGDSSDLQVTSAARQIASALLFAQTASITDQQPCQGFRVGFSKPIHQAYNIHFPNPLSIRMMEYDHPSSHSLT